jgi:sulfur carrier protein
MVLIVNGETIEARAPDLRALLAELDYEGDHVAIAVNHEVVPRARWSATPLSEGDAVEIISPRQGG